MIRSWYLLILLTEYGLYLMRKTRDNTILVPLARIESDLLSTV